MYSTNFRYLLSARLLLLFWVFIGVSIEAVASNPSGALRIEVTTAYNFIVDSNVESPSTYAPRAAYISARIWNDGVADLTDVYANVGNGIGQIPGVYAETTVLVGEGRGYDGIFSLVHEGGSNGTADASRYLGTIPAGDYVPVYWLVNYPNLDGNGNSVTGGIKPADDLVLNYSIWATDGVLAAQVDRTATMRNCISAMANKIFPNTANKVPQEYKDILLKYAPSWSTTGQDGTPGTSLLTEGIWYDLGNVGQGFDNNGDLVPDYNAWLQPIGDPSLIDTSAFRLANTYALIVVKLKGGGELIYDVRDQLYFENIPENTGVIGLVRYDFLPMKSGASATMTPYQMAASGFDNEKFNGDYGVGVGGLVSADSEVTLDKTVDKAAANLGDALAYTIDFDNIGAQPVGDLESTLPLVLQDSIPADTTYVAGSAATGNTLPASVGAYTIYYSTDDGLTWATTEPAAASVTDLQWWLSDVLPASESGTVTFSVTIDNTPGVLAVPNTAGLSFGDTVPFLTDDALTLISGTLNISGTVFVDDGNGVTDTFGNGIQDSLDEAGISNVTVSLYYDSNNNDVVDSGDVLIGTIDSAASTGDYTFGSLAAGEYVVAVDSADAQIILPGSTNTNPEEIAVTLVATDSTENDFGFAPTLQVVKDGTLSAKEGDTVSYTIDVTNQYPSGGFQEVNLRTATGQTTGSGQSAWTTPENALDVDGVYAVAPYQGSKETLTLTGLTTPAGSGTITSLDLVFYATVTTGDFTGTSTLEIELLNGATSLYIDTTYLASNFNGQNYAAVVVNIPGAWAWDDLSNLSVELSARKSSNPAGELSLDAMQVRITSTETTTLSVVPLVDLYNADELTFVGATPAADTTDVTGAVGTLTWNNIGPIAPGNTSSVTVNFTANTLPDNIALTTTDVASVTGATFSNGDPANDGSDYAETLIIPEGAIGDTIFFDVNQNGVQDENEPGIEGALVNLYESDGLTFITSTLTDADGLYQFGGLDAGDYVVRPDTTTGALNVAGLVLTADPEADGEPCLGGCDGEDAVTLAQGQVYAGADFGYFLPGGVISGTLWIDFDDDGVVDAGEVGLPYITVELYSNDGVTLLASTVTDVNGDYSFGGLADGTYRVIVDGADADFPNAIGQTYEIDAPIDEDVAGIVVSGGEVTGTYAGLGDQIDFGYRYAGDNSLSGTIGLEDPTTSNGVMGSGTSGVDGDEVAFENVLVYVYLWNDDGDATVETGEATLLGQTSTDANGDYSFTDLPEGDGDDLYIISTVPPIDSLVLNTVVSDTPASVLVNTTNPQAHSTGSYQALPVAQTITDMDFAYESVLEYDFGDLPASYSVLLPEGARHEVSLVPDLYLGTGVDTESNGVISVSADDDLFDDGVVVSTSWQNGSSGGSVDIDVTGSGWLVGYIDFDNDGNFLGNENLVISQSVTSGSLSLNFDVPTDTLDTEGTTQLYARFRLLEFEPFFAELGYSGESGNGEVEDYRWAFNTISGSVYVDGGNGAFGIDDTEQAGVPVTLYEGLTVLATTVTDANGFYSFYGVPDGSYTVQMSLPAGSTALDDIDGGTLTTNGDQTPIVLAGSSASGQDFLLTGLPTGTAADIRGTVFFDTVDDDTFTVGDTGRQGVEIELYRDIDASGTIGENERIGSTTTDANGDYVFMDLPSGDYLLSMINTSSVVAIEDIDGALNGDNLIAVTLVTTDLIDQDFLTDASSTPQACMMINGSSKDAMFMRTEGEIGITYSIEYVQALTNPTIWAGTVTLDGTNTSAVSNGDGTETVTVTDVPGLVNLEGGRGFFRLLRTENGETLASSVNGWVDTTFGTTCRTYNNPFISCSLLTSTVTAVSGQDVTLLDAVPALPAGSHYIEITSGDFEGHRFDFTTVLGNTLTLESDSDLCVLAAPLNTLLGAPSANLVGDSISIHTHRTLNSTYPVDEMSANIDQDFADQVIMWNDGTFLEYYLYAGTPNKWVLVGDATLADQGEVALPPGHGSFVSSKAIKTITAYGHVRDYDFARPVCDDRNLMGGGYPLDQSALERDYTKTAGFDGNPDFKLADQFLIWNGDNTAGDNGYNLYYYLDYSTFLRWIVMGDASVAPREGELLFLRDRAVMLESKLGLETYIQPLPWAP